MKTIGFIGMGNMAGAIVRGMVQKGSWPAGDLYAYDPYTDHLNAVADELGIHPCTSNAEMVEAVDAVVVAVKPNLVETTLAPLREALKNKVVLSVAAGWNFDRYKALLDSSTRHLYLMPNTPMLVGDGVILLEEENSLTAGELEQVKAFMAPLGLVEVLPKQLMGIAGTVSSCSPAWVAMAVEALADAGVKHGLSRPLAYRLVSQAVAGSGKLLLETGMHPGQLKDMVCSPGGTTIIGVSALEETGLRHALLTAVDRIEG